jgi:hypothetical protein
MIKDTRKIVLYIQQKPESWGHKSDVLVGNDKGIIDAFPLSLNIINR